MERERSIGVVSWLNSELLIALVSADAVAGELEALVVDFVSLDEFMTVELGFLGGREFDL